MPPKKAGGKEGGEAPAAKAPAPKAEKGPAPVDDKKPKTQPKQDEKPQNTKGQEKAQEKPQGKGKGKQVEEEHVVETTPVTGRPVSDRQYEPDDDVEKEIKSRIDKLESEMKVHRDEIEQIRSTIENKKDSQVKLKQDQDVAIKSAQGVGDPKIFNDKFNAKMEQIKHLQKLREDKNNEKKDLRAQLGRGVVDIQYFRKLESDIKALQDKQASGNVGKLDEEKKLIAEIGKLNNLKKVYKAFDEVKEVVNQYDTQITTLRTELDVIKSERQDYREKRREFDEVINASRGQHKSNSEEIDSAITRRKELNDLVTALRGKVDACYDELREHRSGKRDKAKKERQEEQKKRQEERRQQELKRQKEEEARGCYAEELEACTQLLQYLEPFKYRAPEEEKKEEDGEKKEGEGEGEEKEKEESEEAPAVSTPPPSRRGGQKNKPTGETDPEKEIKHAAQIFFHFETLSLVAPQKVGDVEATLTQISEKKEYIEKKEAELRERRKANGTQAV